MATRLAPAATPFKVARVAGVAGAEITGIDLSARLDKATIAAIMQSLVDHKILFFPNQPMTTDQQLEFGRQLGPLEIHPFRYRSKSGEQNTGFYNDNDRPEVIVVESKKGARFAAEQWHSDVSFREEPSLGSILRCVTAPAYGGDTLWADMEAAYEGLDDSMKRKLERLTATHDWHVFRANMQATGASREEVDALRASHPEVEHPVIRTHPVSGRKCIYVNPNFTVRINGILGTESNSLLEMLYRLPFKPEYQVRFRWSPDTIAIWDNRSTQHCALGDFGDQHRRMERVTLAGDRPF